MSEAPPDPLAEPSAAAPTGAHCALPPYQMAQPAHHQPLDVPEHALGLLRIRVPVRVTLAAQRKPIQEIIELGPGSIVKFDKTCDEALELCIGDQAIALGDVVKVGDKFGLRIQGLITPETGAN